MSLLRACLRVVKRFVSKLLLILFILGMAAIPLPMLPFMAFLVKLSPRRSVPTLVVRKEQPETGAK